MRLVVLILLVFAGISANAQTYPKYTGQKANETAVSKPTPTNSATVESKKEKAVKKVKPKGDFQELMERAVVQSQDGKYKKALDLYTQALNVSNEEQAWRALVSRATTYTMMGRKDMAYKDLTQIIEKESIPDKQLANIYLSRARLLMEKGDKEAACSDVNKAREIGIPKVLEAGLECG